jgi:diguanylate cyclase (GGDEF)-like protein
MPLVLILAIAPNTAHSEQWMTELSATFKVNQAAIQSDPEALLQRLLAEPPQPASSALHRGQYHYILSQAYYTLSYPKQALEQSRLGLVLVELEQQPWLFHNLRLAESKALQLIGRPREGLVATNDALIWAELQNDKNLLTLSLLARGELLNNMANFVGALNDFQRAYELAAEVNIQISQGEVAGMIALVYEYRREYALAIPFFEEEVTHQRRIQNWIGLSIALYGLGNANKSIGKLESARSQLTESLALAEQVHDTQGVAYALMELADFDVTELNYLAAQQKFLKAKDIFAQAEHRNLQFNVAIHLTSLARLQKKPTLAVQYLRMAEELIDSNSMPTQRLSLDEEESHVLALQGDFPQAYRHLVDTIVARNKLNRQKSTEQFHQLRTLYEIEVKEKQNKLLEQENKLQKSRLTIQDKRTLQLMTLAAFSSLLFLLLVILFYYSKKNRTRLEKLANTDGLTGLMNRRKTLELLALQLELANRREMSLSVAMVDMDNFKQVNDKYGHATGDKVLIEFSHLCRNIFRQTDIVGRIGGEEFLIVLPHIDENRAHVTLEGLRLGSEKLSTSIGIEGLSVSISCGLCQHPGQASVEAILAHVDSALYEAKHQGRNRISLSQMPSETEEVPA